MKRIQFVPCIKQNRGQCPKKRKGHSKYSQNMLPAVYEANSSGGDIIIIMICEKAQILEKHNSEART